MIYSFVDERITSEELNNLKSFNIKVFKVPSTNKTYDAISGHPDILMHIIDNKIILHKDSPKDFVNLLKNENFDVFLSSNSLDEKYPKDIILNAVSTDKFLIHNIKFTDKKLLELANDRILINVAQGYTKCSTALVSDSAIITSDLPIAKSLYNEGFDVLHIPSGDIILENMDYGFIGGTCGLIDKNSMLFYGNIDFFHSKKEIYEFLKKHKVEPYFLSKSKLTDRGSILSISK